MIANMKPAMKISSRRVTHRAALPAGRRTALVVRAEVGLAVGNSTFFQATHFGTCACSSIRLSGVNAA